MLFHLYLDEPTISGKQNNMKVCRTINTTLCAGPVFHSQFILKRQVEIYLTIFFLPSKLDVSNSWKKRL